MGYSAAYEKILYEGHQYRFIKTETKGAVRIDEYHCEHEQHILKIYLIGKKVCYIDTYYKSGIFKRSEEGVQAK